MFGRKINLFIHGPEYYTVLLLCFFKIWIAFIFTFSSLQRTFVHVHDMYRLHRMSTFLLKLHIAAVM